MRILISGASGLIGTALCKKLGAEGHKVSRLVRPGARIAPGDVRWDPNEATADLTAMAGTEAVIHLSGASIADGRWTDERKLALRNSRVDSTRVLVDMVTHLPQKPKVFVCASAVGYYGSRGDEVLTEGSSYGTDFLGLLARDWEAEAVRASHVGIRTVMLRFGVILAAQGGALPQMIAPFRFGLGGRLGSGKQWMSWIAFEDAIEIARTVIFDDKYKGPINVVAPNPVRNEEFTRIVSRVLHRPAVLPAPAFALRLVLGEMADSLPLASQRARPEKLLQAAYSFREAELAPALRKMLGATGAR